MTQRTARLLVFFTSASVLVIEILAVRMLAPHLGSSLPVFTGVVGVVLAGISVGAWLGGRLADRTDPRSLIGAMLIVGGLTAMASPLLIDLVGPSLSNDVVSIVGASAIGFLVPAALLSTIPPLVVKIRLQSLDQTGAVVGSYSAVGTAGAILGSFMTGFFLVANYPTRPIVAVVGGLLCAVGVVMWFRRSTSRSIGAGAAALILGTTLILVPGPCQYETTYHCAIVLVDEERPTGRTLLLDRLHNSYVDIADPTYLHFRYIRVMADVLEVQGPPGPVAMVSIGGGGMTFPGYIEATRPGSTNTVLEIDGGVVDIARKHLALHDNVNVVVEDARLSLREVASSSADVVMGDAFSGLSVPWHLTTVEYVREIQRVLTADGVYLMNVIDYGPSRFARSTARTLASVFDHVVLLAPRSYLDGSGGNFVFAASDATFDLAAIELALARRGDGEAAIYGAELADWAAGGLLLTDDFAPVDQMLMGLR